MSAAEFHIVLYQPVIPQNTGSIARLCACTGATLHLIHPLGFDTDEKAVRRAGLDYWPHVSIQHHDNWEAFLETQKPERLFFFTKLAKRSYASVRYVAPLYLVFGNETQGLPPEIHARYADSLIQVPMRTQLVRSLNLSQCVGIALYEALRQHDFPIDLG